MTYHNIVNSNSNTFCVKKHTINNFNNTCGDNAQSIKIYLSAGP